MFKQLLQGAGNVARKMVKGAALALTGALGLGAAAVATSLPASAAIDVTEVTTAITDAAAAVATVGGAVLVVIVGIFVWKWISRAI